MARIKKKKKPRTITKMRTYFEDQLGRAMRLWEKSFDRY